MSDLGPRILSLFSPDGSTELTGREIVQKLDLGPLLADKAYPAIRSLMVANKLAVCADGLGYKLAHTVELSQNNDLDKNFGEVSA